MSRTVVLAYSGGLDTSVCVKWLRDRGWRVVAFMADVGQGLPGRTAITRAKCAGAAKVIIRDLKEEFIQNYIWPALKADAIYEGKYLLATALSRPLIASHLVRVAHAEKAQAVGHGCTGKGNDQVRFEYAVRMEDPTLSILAPVREWEFRSREEQIDYAKRHRIPIDVTKKSPYSVDENLWGVSIEAGVLEDPWKVPPRDTYRSVRPLDQAAARPIIVTIQFVKGIPIALNGRRMSSIKLIQRLSVLGGAHGIGRVDMIESRVVGIKSREIYEAPAAAILMEAHQDLERMVLDRHVWSMKQQMAIIYGELVYSGLWGSVQKRALDGFIEETQKRVSGQVRVRLFKGSVQAIARRSPKSLYRKALATYSKGDRFDQRAAEGFIKLSGLPFEGQAKRS